MRSMPAPMRLAASSSAASTSGSRSVTPEPRPGRLAEHVDRLATHGPLCVDPLDRGGRQAPGLDLGHGAPVGLAKQLGLEREVDRSRGDVQRELLRLEVVLEQGHRERQGDPVPRPCGSPASQRSIVAPASGRPDASSPLTPNRRRIARSWPIVVEARARAPHAPASASARAMSVSSGPQSAVMPGSMA